MTANIGTTDRIMRLAIGTGLIVFGAYFRSGFAILGGLFSLYEALASWCVFYQLIGRNTCPLPSSKRPSLDLLGIFVRGLAVLIVAIGLNVLAGLVSWTTWYGLLQQPSTLSNLNVDNMVFLFLVYPFLLGVVAKYAQWPVRAM